MGRSHGSSGDEAAELTGCKVSSCEGRSSAGRLTGRVINQSISSFSETREDEQNQR